MDFELSSRRLEKLAHRLYDEVVASRMQPFSDGMHGFARLVRDMARELGKKVRLEILGEATPVDRDILEKLEAPLSHLIRNALDHGLETPEEREQAGKPAEGRLTVEARHVAGMLNIIVADDGRGIPVERLRAKVVERGLVHADMAAGLTKGELLEFLFLPGFSTASTVTEISGRGVGLDVVFTMAQEVGGTVRVDSAEDKGTRFLLLLPLTLSVIRTLLVEIDSETYAMPLTRIDRILRVPYSELGVIEDRQFYNLDGENVGIVDARQLFRITHAAGRTDPCHLLIFSDRMSRFGLVVDRFLGQQDLVVRPLDPRLGKLANISAGAILEDGSPVLILDVDDLVRSIDHLRAHVRPRKVGLAAQVREEAGGPKRSWSSTTPDGPRGGAEIARDGGLRGHRGRGRRGRLEQPPGRRLRPGRLGRGHAADERDRAGPEDQGRPDPSGAPGDDRLLQGPRGGPAPRAGGRGRLLPHQEQFPRRDAP